MREKKFYHVHGLKQIKNCKLIVFYFSLSLIGLNWNVVFSGHPIDPPTWDYLFLWPTDITTSPYFFQGDDNSILFVEGPDNFIKLGLETEMIEENNIMDLFLEESLPKNVEYSCRYLGPHEKDIHMDKSHWSFEQTVFPSQAVFNRPFKSITLLEITGQVPTDLFLEILGNPNTLGMVNEFSTFTTNIKRYYFPNMLLAISLDKKEPVLINGEKVQAPTFWVILDLKKNVALKTFCSDDNKLKFTSKKSPFKAPEGMEEQHPLSWIITSPLDLDEAITIYPVGGSPDIMRILFSYKTKSLI